MRPSLRNSGLGWLAFQIGPDQRAQLLTLIAGELAQPRRTQ
jgi:hypothetical protein